MDTNDTNIEKDNVPKKETPTPIIHSLQTDNVTSARKIVGSNEIPEDEALFLVRMKDQLNKKKRFGFFSVLSIIVVILALGSLLIPDDFFIKPDTGIVITTNQNQNIINVDNSYSLVLPTPENLIELRDKVFDGETGISEINILKNESRVKFMELMPFISENFLLVVGASEAKDYVYGYIKYSKDEQYPFFVFSVDNQEDKENKLLMLERTMYTDLKEILRLPNVAENDILLFETSPSIRVPARILTTRDGKELIIYGSPVNNVFLFSTSSKAYRDIRERILSRS